MNIIWRGNVNSNRGFGNVTTNLTQALLRMGHNVAVEPVYYPEEAVPASVDSAESQRMEDGESSIAKHRPYINCVNNYTVSARYPYPQIFYTASEGTSCSRQILSIQHRLAEVWVPSMHSKVGLEHSGIAVNVRIIPHGVDLSLFNPTNITQEKSSRFRFLSVFRWTWRKAPELLLGAFKEEFSENEAELVLKTGRIHTYSNDIPRNLGRNVLILTEDVNISQLCNLYASAHAFVLATRGEGWGLPITEAGAMGLPIIVTKWGGQMDYLDSRWAYLIEVERLVVPPKEARKEPGILYAEPSFEDLRQKMRQVYENYQEAKKKADMFRVQLAVKWTWDNAATAATERIKQIFS